MVSNLQTLHEHVHGAAKPLVILLTVSVCSGLAYRSLSYHMIILYKRLEDYFAGVFSDADMAPIEADPDIQEASFEEVIRQLKEDFDMEIPYPAPLTDDQKVVELPRLRKYYVELCQHSRKQFDLGIDHMADIMQTAFKIKKEEFKKRFSKPNVGFHLRRWAIAASLCYFTCLVTFMAAVIVTTVFLLNAI
jgi:hypothetical protein